MFHVLCFMFYAFVTLQGNFIYNNGVTNENRKV